jgi:hypothetical protein
MAIKDSLYDTNTSQQAKNHRRGWSLSQEHEIVSVYATTVYLQSALITQR